MAQKNLIGNELASEFRGKIEDNFTELYATSLGLLPEAYSGLAITTTTPVTVEGVTQWWLASGPGTYTNFGGLIITGNFAILSYSGAEWTKYEQTITAPNVVQTTGTSTTDVMSQKAVSDKLIEVQVNVKHFGAKGDGVTDDTDAVSAAIVFLHENNGGELFFPKGAYLINSQIKFPTYTDGAGAPIQQTMIIRGEGMQSHGRGSGIPLITSGGTVLDLRYNGGEFGLSKIASIGFGYLEICGLTLTDNGTSNNPFFKSTNTTVNIHDVSFIGNQTKAGTTCDQDAIILGGTNLPIGTDFDTTEDGPFQGYGSCINNIWYSRIRSGIMLGNYANQINISNLTFWQLCGGDAAIKLNYSDTADNIFGSIIENILVEASFYTHAIIAKKYSRALISNVGCYDYDGNPSWISPIRLELCNALTIIAGFWGMGDDPYITTVSGQWYEMATLISRPLTAFGCPVEAKLGIEIRANGGGADGSLKFARPVDALTGPQAQFAVYGRKWMTDGSGDNMEIDTGEGGSFLDIRAWSVRIKNQTGAQSGIELMAGTNFKGAMKTGIGFTDQRPSASGCGKGAFWFDAEINKPIWSDGTNWRDAMGIIV